MEQQAASQKPNSAVKKTALSHAYLIWGGDEQTRAARVGELSSATVCEQASGTACLTCAHCRKASKGIHPDIIRLGRNEENRLIQVDQIRALLEDAYLLPNEAQKKVYIIEQAGSMTTQAQNALLKMLEEPPYWTGFILAEENPFTLLQTVRSRCVEFQAGQPVDGVPLDNPQVKAFFRALEDGPLALTAFSFTLDKLDKNALSDFLTESVARASRLLRQTVTGSGGPLSAEYLSKTIRALERAGQQLELNVGRVHVAGMLCAVLLNRNEEQYD